MDILESSPPARQRPEFCELVDEFNHEPSLCKTHRRFRETVSEGVHPRTAIGLQLPPASAAPLAPQRILTSVNNSHPQRPFAHAARAFFRGFQNAEPATPGHATPPPSCPVPALANSIHSTKRSPVLTLVDIDRAQTKPCNHIFSRRNRADAAMSPGPVTGLAPSSIEIHPVNPAPFNRLKIRS